MCIKPLEQVTRSLILYTFSECILVKLLLIETLVALQAVQHPHHTNSSTLPPKLIDLVFICTVGTTNDTKSGAFFKA